MRVLTCVVYDHNILLLLLSALVCVFGCAVTVRLAHRAIQVQGNAGLHWLFLASVCAGSSIWATHFIAMLGYRPRVPVHFDATLTIVSALIAVVGTAIGLRLAKLRSQNYAATFGGGAVGIAIAAMHYVGMFAYRPDGIVAWKPVYVVVSVASAIILSAFAIRRLRNMDAAAIGPAWDAVAHLVAAILLLHFTGMAAFTVMPIDGFSGSSDSEVFVTLAAAIALAAAMIVGTGISTHLVEEGRANAQERLQRIAMHDALTDIANRHSFVIQLADECARLDSPDANPFALFLIDLDRFKAVNDTLGHPVGDLLLRHVAIRLQQVARSGDVVARIGGDEFALMARGLADRDVAQALAESMVKVLSSPFNVAGHIVEIGASVGVTLAPADSRDSETLNQQADLALYRAKRDGRGRVCVFEPVLTKIMLERCALENELRHAWANDNFDLLYQPIYDTRFRRLTGAEALLRWQSATRGDIPPDVFIPIAEELGLMSAIGDAVLKKACTVAATWPSDLTLSVNVSPVQIANGGFVQSVKEALDLSGLSACRLEIEIVEGSLLSDDAIVLATLEQLRAMGLKIALDDFGKGYSSLAYLHRFPLDRIKIDRSFIAKLPADANSASIVKSICQLGESLGLEVTAEGIESLAQLSFVAGHGCTHVQGFLLGEPATQVAINSVLAAQSYALDLAAAIVQSEERPETSGRPAQDMPPFPEDRSRAP